MRRHRPSYATICEWSVDAWVNVSACAGVRVYAKVGIISEAPHGNETDSDNDARKPGVFDYVHSSSFWII